MGTCILSHIFAMSSSNADLLVAHIDPVATGGKCGDVCGQLPMLALPQKLLLACLVHPQRGPHSCQEFALEPSQGPRNAPSGCAVYQLQLSSTVFEAVQSDVALCNKQHVSAQKQIVPLATYMKHHII